MEHTPSKNIQGFPSDFCPLEEKKSKEYILKYFKAMYDAKKKNADFFEKENDHIITNRKYAEGMQSSEKYKNWYAIAEGEGDGSYANLDYTPIPIVKKYVQLRLGEMLNTEYEIISKATDIISQADKTKERNKLLANMKLKPFSDMIKEETGVPVISDDEYIPADKEELEIHSDMNLKLAAEIAIEELVDYILNCNDWETEKKHVAKDFLTIKKSSIRLYYDENYRVRLRYSDWGNMIVPFCVKEDLSDAKYVGEIIKLPIYQIRRMDVNGDLSEEDLFNIAKGCAGKHGNSGWNNRATTFHQYYNANGVSATGYDDFLIPVLDGQFLSMNVSRWEEKPNSKGGFYFNRKSVDYKPKDETRRIIDKEIEYKYKGMWIVDTDYIFNFGMANDILHSKKNGKISPQAKLDYVMLFPDMLDMSNKSMVEDIIPHADQIMLVALKIQHLVAKLTPPGLAIDINALKDIFLGKGKAWNPLQLTELYQASGTFFYNGVDLNGMPINRKPIEEIKTSLGQILTELIGLYNFHMQQIRDISGINEIRDASAPDKDAGLGIRQMAMQGSRNATRAIDYAFVSLFEKAGNRVAEMIQYNIAKGRCIEEYQNVIGKIAVDGLKLLKEIPLRDLGIFIEAKIEGEDRALLEQNIQSEIKIGTLGTEDAIMIRQILNTKKANRYLIYRKKKRLEEQMAMKQQDVTLNAQAQQQSNQQAAQNKMMELQAKAEAELIVLREEERINKERDALLHGYKMEEIGKQSDVDFHLQALQGAMKPPVQAAGAMA